MGQAAIKNSLSGTSGNYVSKMIRFEQKRSFYENLSKVLVIDWIEFDGPFRSKNCPRKRQYLIENYDIFKVSFIERK